MRLFKDTGLISGYRSAVNQEFEKNIYSIGSISQKNAHIFESAKKLQFEFEENYKLNFEYPAYITNAIVSLNKHSINDKHFNNLSKILNALFTKDLVILATDSLEYDDVEKLIKGLSKFDVDSIIFCFTYKDDFHSDDFAELFENSSFIAKVIVFKSPFDKNYANKYFFYVREFSIANEKNIAEFESNITLFSESQLHHTYFNQKIYVDVSGNIRNAPECEEVYGNIENYAAILKIIERSDFQKYWNVHKDICDVCKDCEFRHMCIDNRIPFQRKKNEWYHKIECNYNPYIAKWAHEEGFVSLAESGVISNEDQFFIDHELLRIKNK